MRTLKTTGALTLALLATLAGQGANAEPDATADAYTGPAIGAHALHDGQTWTEPGPDWRDGLTATGPTVPASTVAAQEDKPNYYGIAGCHAPKSQTSFDPCTLGDPDGDTTWLVLGSSKAGTWVDPLAEIAERSGARLEVGTRSATPWTPGLGDGQGRQFNDAALKHIQQTEPHVLFMVADDNSVSPGDWDNIIDRALGSGAGHVAVLWNPGGTEPNPMTCLENEPEDYRDCSFRFVTEGAELDLANRANTDPNLSYLSVQDWIAPEGTGFMVIGDVITRGAGSHLTASYVDTLELPLQSELHEAGLVDANPDAVTRIAGANRYETAAKLAMMFPASAMTSYVASGLSWADALSAGAVTGGWDRLVLTKPDGQPQTTRDALFELGRGMDHRAVVVGGPGAVADTVIDQLRAMGGWPVDRLAGENRYETAAKVARDALAGHDVDRVYLASGETFPDAIAAASHAGDSDALLLTKKGDLPTVTADALADLDPRQIVVVGGYGVISHAVEMQVKEATGTTPVRAAGADRWATSAALFAYSGTAQSADTVLVATGLDFPDALAAGQMGSPLVLTKPDQLPSVVRDAIRRHDKAVLIGGAQAVNTDVERAIQDLVVRR